MDYEDGVKIWGQKTITIEDSELTIDRFDRACKEAIKNIETKNNFIFFGNKEQIKKINEDINKAMLDLIRENVINMDNNPLIKK